MLTPVEGTGKNQLEPGQDIRGMLQSCYFVISCETLTKTDRCVGALP